MRKLIIGMLAAAAMVLLVPISAQAEETVEVWWLVPEGAELEATDHPKGDGFRVGSDGFPQVLLPGGLNDLPCDRLAQVDIYPSSAAYDIIKDGVLHEGEDYDAIISWRFVRGVCVPDEPDENVIPEIPESLPEPAKPTVIETAAA